MSDYTQYAEKTGMSRKVVKTKSPYTLPEFSKQEANGRDSAERRRDFASPDNADDDRYNNVAAPRFADAHSPNSDGGEICYTKSSPKPVETFYDCALTNDCAECPSALAPYPHETSAAETKFPSAYPANSAVVWAVMHIENN